MIKAEFSVSLLLSHHPSEIILIVIISNCHNITVEYFFDQTKATLVSIDIEKHIKRIQHFFRTYFFRTLTFFVSKINIISINIMSLVMKPMTFALLAPCYTS